MSSINCYASKFYALEIHEIVTKISVCILPNMSFCTLQGTEWPSETGVVIQISNRKCNNLIVLFSSRCHQTEVLLNSAAQRFYFGFHALKTEKKIKIKEKIEICQIQMHQNWIHRIHGQYVCDSSLLQLLGYMLSVLQGRSNYLPETWSLFRDSPIMYPIGYRRLSNYH